MTFNIPSTTVKSKYLESLPISTVFLDPRNNSTHIKSLNAIIIRDYLPKVTVIKNFVNSFYFRQLPSVKTWVTRWIEQSLVNQTLYDIFSTDNCIFSRK